MPRDVEIGEGYEGDQMVSQQYPGQHIGRYALNDGDAVLMRPGTSMAIPAKGRGGGTNGLSR